MLVAANVVHATTSLEQSLKTARSLLKPGGHVLLLEITNERQFRIGFCFGQFTGWWAGVEEGQTLQPFVSIAQWNDVLQRTGFSTIDTRTADMDAEIFAISVFSAHAVEPRINFLHYPLSGPIKDPAPQLVVVGGAAAVSSMILTKLYEALPNRRIKSVTGLEDLLEQAVEPNATFVVLSDLDSELFAELSSNRYEGLKTMFQHAKNTIWITENAWDDHPHQAMTIGMIRSLRTEKTDTNIQVIDCDSAQDLDVIVLVEQMLRIEAEQGMIPNGLVWYNEPELRLERGQLFVPRYQVDTVRVNRYNSASRPITSDISIDRAPVELKKQHDQWFYQVHQDHLPHRHSARNNVRMRLQYSLPFAVRVGNVGYFYLVQGHVPSTGHTVLALSETASSLSDVPVEHTVPLRHFDNQQGGLLFAVAAELLAQSMLSAAAPGAPTLVLEPYSFMTEALVCAAERNGSIISLATAGEMTAQPKSPYWISLHDKSSQRALSSALPKRSFSTFFDLSTYQSTAGLAHRVQSCLPKSCVKFGLEYAVTVSYHIRS